jgi:hypothetical protein
MLRRKGCPSCSVPAGYKMLLPRIKKGRKNCCLEQPDSIVTSIIKLIQTLV